jgi:hypothetical protein
MSIYWYVSQQKIEALKADYGKSPLDWLKTLALSLKFQLFEGSPSVEASASFRTDPSRFEMAEKIGLSLFDRGIDNFDELQTDRNTGFFYFDGRATRSVIGDKYFVTIQRVTRGLLLAGSSFNAIGDTGTIDGEGRLSSPSKDPIGAIQQVVELDQGARDPHQGLAEDVSFVWGSLREPYIGSLESLPLVSGIAIYGGRVAASRTQLRRLGFPDVTELIIGSPIYIRQKA